MGPVTWWLSFSSEDAYLGAVLVDADSFEQAFLAALSVSPGGQVYAFELGPDSIPDQHREAFAALPRLTLLGVDDLRVLGPLQNLDGQSK